MNELKTKLMSRKLWIAVLTAAIAAFSEQLGLSGVFQAVIAATGGSYVIAQGLADGGSQGQWMAEKTPAQKLKSRKLISTLVTIALLVLGKKIGLSEADAIAIGGAVSAFNVGQGIADAGAQGQEEI